MEHASTFLPRGTVFGTLLNFQREYAVWKPFMDGPPYFGEPQSPILYIKPANTWRPSGMGIPIPEWVPEVEIGASIAMVIGSSMQVSDFVIVNDLSIPHHSFYRPPTQYKSLDGFFGIANTPLKATLANDPATFALEVFINEVSVQSIQFSDLLRPAAKLIQEITEFMTLNSGDWLMLGLDIPKNSSTRPHGRIGDHIEIRGKGFTPVINTLVREIVS